MIRSLVAAVRATRRVARIVLDPLIPGDGTVVIMRRAVRRIGRWLP